MPIFLSSQRRSFVPDVYKRASIIQKVHRTTPYYEQRKSTPFFQEKNRFSSKNVQKYASDSQVPREKRRNSSFNMSRLKVLLHKSLKSPRISNVKGGRKTEPKRSSDKFSSLRSFGNKEGYKPNNNKVAGRKSEYKNVIQSSAAKVERHSYAFRRSLRKSNQCKPTPKEDDLAMICQLLLIRTVTPKARGDTDLLDPFTSNSLDESYFVYYPYIFKYLCERELSIKYNKNYLTANGFTESFRCTLMDWLIKVQLYSKISSESLQVAFILIDMFTSICIIKKSFYQLVGVAALLIACKVVQRFHPRIKDLCYLTENCYIPTHVIQMEKMMLDKINFFVNVPIPSHFCHRGLLACVEIIDTAQLEVFCTFMFDLIILHVSSAGIRPSCKSAAAIFIGRFIFYSEYPTWTRVLQHYTLYRLQQLKDCVLIYLDVLNKLYNSDKFIYKAVLQKYSTPTKKAIAKNDKICQFVKNSESQALLKSLFEA